MESIQAESEPIDEEEDVPPGGIPARNASGERLLLFVGIIDILQSYRLRKKLEHSWKSIIHDGDTVSVHKPGFYAQRFQDFMSKTVFKKIPSPLKHSPSKRKSISRPVRQPDELDTPGGATSGVPSLSCCSTPPPPFEEAATSSTSSSAYHHPTAPGQRTSRTNSSSTTSSSASVGPRYTRRAGGASSAASVLTASSASSLALTPATRSHDASVCWTPPASAEGSTPTWTEGTPSFTESSSSDQGFPTTPQRVVTPADSGHALAPATSLSPHRAAPRRTAPPAPPPRSTHHHQDINCLTTEMMYLKDKVESDYK